MSDGKAMAPVVGRVPAWWMAVAHGKEQSFQWTAGTIGHVTLMALDEEELSVATPEGHTP